MRFWRFTLDIIRFCREPGRPALARFRGNTLCAFSQASSVGTSGHAACRASISWEMAGVGNAWQAGAASASAWRGASGIRNRPPMIRASSVRRSKDPSDTDGFASPTDLRRVRAKTSGASAPALEPLSGGGCVPGG
jgi:hypothetical protein